MAATENTLILETTQGPVTIEMRPDLAPGHVARIKELVREGFYDGIVFHRVIDGFMAQTGCPQGTGMGGSGKKLKAEFNGVKRSFIPIQAIIRIDEVEKSGVSKISSGDNVSPFPVSIVGSKVDRKDS